MFLISHDLEYVKKYADHVVLLDQTVLTQGTVKEVFESKEFLRVFGEKEETWIHAKNQELEEAWEIDFKAEKIENLKKGGNKND